ncbi:MAG: hypothetical protein E7633_09295 [Ruminococcaceae bacterium]|nr:hypothetical protein [Oscillospiraceae bacterium]
MNVIDGAKNVKFCFEYGVFSKERWNTYIEEIYLGARSVIESDAKDYDYAHDILPVLNLVYSESQKLQKLHSSFEKVTHNLEEKIKNTLQTSIDADIVLCLGMCNGAGWATKINGKSVVLLGIEKIIELDWVDEASMTALIYHELGHLWHFQERTLYTHIETPKEKALWQLYSEGVAMYCEQLLMNGEFFHQDKNGWLNWCTENEKKLFSEYLIRVQDGKSVQNFFGDWNSFEGHSDTGYFIGAKLVREATQKYSLKKILNLSFYEIEELLYFCAEK